jgi:predicted ABC-type ATPase
MKQLWILAGANGSGKSTFFDHQLKKYNLSFINADLIAKKISGKGAGKVTNTVSKVAQQEALQTCHQKLDRAESFCYETVFSHISKIEIIEKAKRLGYEINLVFIHLNLAMLNKARVIQRVHLGGHTVPEDKIESRIPRTLKNIKLAIRLCDNVQMLDNSSSQNPFKVILTIQNNKIIFKTNPLPEWAQEIIS